MHLLMFISCSLDGNSMHSNCDPFERQDNTAEICTTCFFCGDGHISSRLLGRGGCTTWPGSGKTTDEFEITYASLKNHTVHSSDTSPRARYLRTVGTYCYVKGPRVCASQLDASTYTCIYFFRAHVQWR